MTLKELYDSTVEGLPVTRSDGDDFMQLLHDRIYKFVSDIMNTNDRDICRHKELIWDGALSVLNTVKEEYMGRGDGCMSLSYRLCKERSAGDASIELSL